MTTIEIKGKKYRFGFNMMVAETFRQLTGIDVLREPEKMKESEEQDKLTFCMAVAMLIGSNPDTGQGDPEELPGIQDIMVEMDTMDKWNKLNEDILREYTHFHDPDGSKAKAIAEAIKLAAEQGKELATEVPEKKKGQKKKH